MSAKGYLSPEGVARFMRKGYYSPVGVARKLVKAYCSPDGVARLAWEAGGRVRAYLYNGVKLPELPEWDMETYPYAAIGYSGATDNNAVLCVSAGPVIVSDSGNLIHSAYQKYKDFLWNSGGVEWAESSSGWAASETLWPGDVFWTNHDIVGKNSTVYLEASDPVPLYSYNGVELPELPEWDRAAYPYAYIMYAKNGVYYLAISATTQTSTVDGRKLLFGDWKYMYTDGAWTTTTAAGYGGDIVWSNYDMYYHERHESAGTVYCEASEPQPVYI